MKLRKPILVLFSVLFLFAQMYSLAAAIGSASTVVPGTLEDLQDTDLEEIVTVDPFLPSKQVDAKTLQQMQFAIPFLAAIVIYLLRKWSALLSIIESFYLRLTRPRPGHSLWLINRALLI